MVRCRAPATGSRRGRELRAVGVHVDDGLRATPESMAAWATAGGMTEISRGSNGTGMMYSGPKRGRAPW